MTQGSINRREFLGTAAAVAAFTFVPKRVLGSTGQSSANNKLNIAGIGVGGQGAVDIKGVESENIAFLCDVDLARAADTIKRYPNAKVYRDFRVMLEKEAKNIDAVVIGAPDHIHAPAAIMAMKMGKHVYCEKPMGHSIYDVRRMTAVARETKVVTQMGNQGHAGEGLRLYWEYIHAGAIGTVKEVHVWTDRAGTPQRAWWPQGIGRPQGSEPVPETLDWDLWLGPARYRPYAKFSDGRGGMTTYAPFNWRGWFDFGCGAMGDMAVHNADPAFFALDLDAPIAVEAETSEVNDETYPVWNIIRYEFPAQGDRPAVKMTWYDGAKLPPRPAELEADRQLGANGILFIGDKGTLMGHQPRRHSHARSGIETERIRSAAEESAAVARALPGMDRRLQSGQARGRQERILVRRAVHGIAAGRQSGGAAEEAGRVGFESPACRRIARKPIT